MPQYVEPIASYYAVTRRFYSGPVLHDTIRNRLRLQSSDQSRRQDNRARRNPELGRRIAGLLAGGNALELADLINHATSAGLRRRFRDWFSDHEFARCNDCEHYYPQEDGLCVSGGAHVCEDCASDYYCCDHCGDHCHGDHISSIEDNSICDDCRDRHYYYWESDDEWHSDPEPEPEPEFEAEQYGDTYRSDPIRQHLDKLPAGIIDSDLANNGISAEGIDEIGSYLEGFHIYRHTYILDLHREREERAADSIEWCTKLGTLPKRISRILAKGSPKIVLSSEALSGIGNIARKHCPKQTSYRWDVIPSRRINWGRSEFGQQASCWWPGRVPYGNSLNAFKAQQNAYAVRFFDADGTGIGRCWAMVLGDTTGDHTGLVLFNTYGPHSLFGIARLLATVWGWHYVGCEFELPSGWYLNSSKCVALSPTALPTDLAFEYDYEIPTTS